MAEAFKIGDFVWAKMKGFPPWPGRVSNPPKDLKNPKGGKKSVSHCIFFFGSKNYAWIEENNLKPYTDYKETLVKGNKSGVFREAVEAIEEFIKNKGESVQEDPDDVFNRLVESADKNKTKPKPKKDLSQKWDSKSPASKRESSPQPTAAKRKRTKRSSSSAEGDGDKSSAYEEANGDDSPSLSTPSHRLTSTTPSTSSHMSSFRKGPRASNLLERPSNIMRPVTPPLDLENVSETLKEKNIKPSALRFGFLGLGIMGSGIVKNLLNSGHSVIVWNRTPDKCKDFVKVGAEEGLTPSDVVQMSDITFSCVADPQAAKDMVFGNCGVLPEAGPSKGYVEMTGIDAETSQDIAEAIMGKGGRYLEAQVQGSKTQAEEGTLVILAAGDRSLFDDCQSCFEAMGNNSFYLGEVGNASKMNLVLQLMAGVTLAGLAEGMALADRAGLQQRDVLEVMELTSIACPTIIDKCKAIIEGEFNTHLPLQHMQKDLKLSLSLGDQLEQPLPLTATANEVFKHAKRLGYGSHDASAVYIRARF
ncbi:putative oxidoreductase GLYR1 homolog [Nilaparvata lugens]|uniref:putative oxidoreductase GLYR1 homolog n=1 Tax=Nilaparvata lugens TaxID=108931 RepID=UPI00193D3A98|nr:putative oxidoreductase GLYR1 homolog [Nilaparvata lugens]